MAVVNPSYRTIKEKLESIIVKVINENLIGYLQTSDVKNNLTSNDTDKPLSAYQGKALNTDKENISNKVTTISSSSTHTQYPSAKLVYDSLNEKANVIDFYYDQNTDELVIQTASNVADWSDIKDYIDDYMGNIIDYIEG